MEERLQKYMASCGVASRRKCEELITKGLVKVNGEVVTELGVKVNATVDVIEYNNVIINKEQEKVYIMLNKPEGIITSVKDEKGRKTIIDILDIKERVFPIGRLDYDSSGLLLLTNDGDIYNKIIHPRVKIKKKYIVVCQGKFSDVEIQKFKNGVDIGDYITAPAELNILDETSKQSIIEISITEGKNRQIRRMCSALNHPVISLKRVAVGELKLGYLKQGEYRSLNQSELDYINSL